MKKTYNLKKMILTLLPLCFLILTFIPMLSSTAKIPGIENGGHHIVSTTIHFNSIFNNVYSLTPFFMVSALIFYSLSIVIDASYPFISKHNYVYLVISINTISMLMFIVSLILGLVGTPNY